MLEWSKEVSLAKSMLETIVKYAKDVASLDEGFDKEVADSLIKRAMRLRMSLRRELSGLTEVQSAMDDAELEEDSLSYVGSLDMMVKGVGSLMADCSASRQIFMAFGAILENNYVDLKPRKRSVRMYDSKYDQWAVVTDLETGKPTKRTDTFVVSEFEQWFADDEEYELWKARNEVTSRRKAKES